MKTSDTKLPVVFSFETTRLVVSPETALKLMEFLATADVKVLQDRYVKDDTTGKYDTLTSIKPATMKNLASIKFLSAAEYLFFTENGEKDEDRS